MIIHEKNLRSMIRKKLLAEITDFGSGTRDLDTAKELPCDHYRTIPKKFAKLLKSKSADQFSRRLAKKFPKLGADLGILGIGATGGKISDRDIDPSDIGSISNITNSGQMLFAYFNSYLFAAGTPCVGFYMLGQLLDFLSFLLGDPVEKQSGLDKKNPYVNFEIAIAEKSQSLSKNLAGFVNNLAFYALPRLSSKSPNADDINMNDLKFDLEDYYNKINAIKKVKDTNIKNCFDNISVILDVKGTSTINNLEVESTESFELAEALKRDALSDLIVAFKKAIKNYEEVIKNNDEFAKQIEVFLRSIS